MSLWLRTTADIEEKVSVSPIETAEHRSFENKDACKQGYTAEQPPKRTTKIRKALQCFEDFTKVAIEYQVAMEEAIESWYKEHWLHLIKEELKSIADNGPSSEATLPSGKSAIPSKIMFLHKLDDRGNVSHFKARLVATALFQKEGDDYYKSFGPVVPF